MQQMYYAPMQQGEQEYMYHQQQQQFSNGQQFYPFPPPFQHYPQQHYQHGPPQQQYFQHPQQMHQHQQSLAPIPVVVDAATASAESTSPSTTAPVALPSPSAELEAPAVPATEESAASPTSPSYAPAPQQPFLPYPQQNFGVQYGFAPNPLSPTLANNAPLGTFFPAGSVAHYSNGGYSKGPSAQRQSIPRRNADDQSPPSTSSLPLGPNGNVKSDARPPRNGRYNADGRSARPNCSFFEANRCRNRDACPFAHLLPDGSDARALGRGLVGIDGRIDGPEERGGIPPAWIAHPKNSNGHPRYNNGHSSSAGGAMSAAQMGGKQNMNGGFSAKERSGRRYEEEQALRAGREAPAGVDAGAEQVAGGETNGEQNLVDSISSLTSATSSNNVPGQQPRALNGHAGRVNAAPSLVAAINGLTRRTPPVAATPSTPPAHTAAQAARQRVPSGADFPALATTDGSPQQFVAPTLTLAEVISTAAAAAPAVAVPAIVEKKEVAPISPTSEADFVLVHHTDAPLPLIDPSIVSISPSSTPVTPTPAVAAPVARVETAVVAAPAVAPTPAAPIPKAVFSFAAAARKGAAIPPPVVPEKAKRAPPVFAASTTTSSHKAGEKGEKGDKDEVVVVKKKGKGSKKNAPVAIAQVAVVA